MKKLMLVVATAVVILTTLAVPVQVMADGNPIPLCNGQMCKP